MINIEDYKLVNNKARSNSLKLLSTFRTITLSHRDYLNEIYSKEYIDDLLDHIETTSENLLNVKTINIK